MQPFERLRCRRLVAPEALDAVAQVVELSPGLIALARLESRDDGTQPLKLARELALASLRDPVSVQRLCVRAPRFLFIVAAVAA